MDISPGGLIRNWLPTLPSQLRTALVAACGKSENASEQDWFIEIVVNAARPILQTPASLLKSQKYLKYDPGIYGHAWIATYTVPPPTQNEKASIDNDILTVEQAVSFAIYQLARFDDERFPLIPPFDPAGIEAEWTSHRRKASPWTRPPKGFSQRQIYDAASHDVPAGEDSPVILYAHGGAFCLMDPANHRINTVDMATSTKARLLSVRYRLSPQAIFPAALLDMFLCYLALLNPPPGAFHKAVPVDRIILAGDSSGGNLVTALQVLLVTLSQHQKAIANPWASGTIRIPSRPNASLSLSSPWLDITRSMPSHALNSRWDFIAPASTLSKDLMSTSPLFPVDEIWPSKPPRTETYCDAVMCAHPLVSPITTSTDVLKNFPSTYICTGWEGMTDESQVFARRIYQAKMKPLASDMELAQLTKGSTDSGYASAAGSPKLGPAQTQDTTMVSSELKFDGYTGMPHTFTIIPHRASTAAKLSRAEHMVRALTGNAAHDSATWTHSKTLTVENIEFSQLGSEEDTLSGYNRTETLTDDFLFRVVDHGREFRVDLEQRLRDQESMGIEFSTAKSSMTGVVGSILSMAWIVIFFVRDMLFNLTYWVLWRMMQL